MEILGMMLIVVGMSGAAMALVNNTVPEIGAGSTASALALLSGSRLLIKSRRKN